MKLSTINDYSNCLAWPWEWAMNHFWHQKGNTMFQAQEKTFLHRKILLSFYLGVKLLLNFLIIMSYVPKHNRYKNSERSMVHLKLNYIQRIEKGKKTKSK